MNPALFEFMGNGGSSMDDIWNDLDNILADEENEQNKKIYVEACSQENWKLAHDIKEKMLLHYADCLNEQIKYLKLQIEIQGHIIQDYKNSIRSQPLDSGDKG
jgi:hypothetical protein